MNNQGHIEHYLERKEKEKKEKERKNCTCNKYLIITCTCTCTLYIPAVHKIVALVPRRTCNSLCFTSACKTPPGLGFKEGLQQ